MVFDSQDFTVDVRRLAILEQLRQHGTVAATAAALHLTPSAVSQQLAVLAREIGVPLVARHGRTVRLTPQAEVLLEHAATIRAQLERVRADLAAQREGRAGTVRLGSFATAIGRIVGPAMVALRTDAPLLRVRVTEVDPPESVERLDTGDLDVVVSIEYLGGPTQTDPRYHRVPLHVDPLDVLLPADHPLAARPGPLRLADLADQPWVCGGGGTPCGQITLSACAAAGFVPEVRHYSRNWTATLALVAAGAGVELVPRLAIDQVPEGAVHRRLLAAPARHIYAATRSGAQDVPHIAAMLDALAKAASQLG
ncbi:MAG TPA: LysR family transcriptional regulator [Streptosporangiales bacterium]